MHQSFLKQKANKLQRVYIFQQHEDFLDAAVSTPRDKVTPPAEESGSFIVSNLFFTSVAMDKKAASTFKSSFADVSKKCILYSCAKRCPSASDTT